ncbi:MAG: rod shape-determining protein MreD [Candidatus Moraniibacteriota bacterium]
MKQFFFSFLSFLCLAVFQFSFMNTLFVSSWFRPNFLVIVTLFSMLRHDFKTTAWWAIALGLMYDLISGGILGMTALFLLWCAYITSFLSQRFLVEHTGGGIVVAGGLAGIFSCLAVFFDAFWIAHFFGSNNSFVLWLSGQSLAPIVGCFILNGIIFFGVLFFQRRFFGRSWQGNTLSISTQA